MNLHIPTFSLPDGYPSSFIYLEEWVLRKANLLYKDHLSIAITERIKHELNVIHRNNLADYFLIWADITCFCEKNHIFTAPGRMRSPISVVLYCLGINKFDPMSEPTIATIPFEYFSEVKGFPNSNMSLMVENGGQEQIYTYLTNKYGKAHVSYISSYSNDNTKHGINSVALLMTDQSVDSYAQICHVKSNGKTYMATEQDVNVLKDLGLTPFNIMDMGTLSVIKHVEERVSISLDWNNLPWKDESTWQLIRHGDTSGAFFLSAQQVQEELKKMKKFSINDLVEIVAAPFHLNSKTYVHFYCYTLISFRCAYLKTHYREIFYEEYKKVFNMDLFDILKSCK